MVIIKHNDEYASFPVLDLLVFYMFDRMGLDTADFVKWVKEEFGADISLQMLQRTRLRARAEDNRPSDEEVPPSPM